MVEFFVLKKESEFELTFRFTYFLSYLFLFGVFDSLFKYDIFFVSSNIVFFVFFVSTGFSNHFSESFTKVKNSYLIFNVNRVLFFDVTERLDGDVPLYIGFVLDGTSRAVLYFMVLKADPTVFELNNMIDIVCGIINQNEKVILHLDCAANHFHPIFTSHCRSRNVELSYTGGYWGNHLSEITNRWFWHLSDSCFIRGMEGLKPWQLPESLRFPFVAFIVNLFNSSLNSKSLVIPAGASRNDMYVAHCCFTQFTEFFIERKNTLRGLLVERLINLSWSLLKLNLKKISICSRNTNHLVVYLFQPIDVDILKQNLNVSIISELEELVFLQHYWIEKCLSLSINEIESIVKTNLKNKHFIRFVSSKLQIKNLKQLLSNITDYKRDYINYKKKMQRSFNIIKSKIQTLYSQLIFNTDNIDIYTTKSVSRRLDTSFELYISNLNKSNILE